jgi:hypothetical protein
VVKKFLFPWRDLASAEERAALAVRKRDNLFDRLKEFEQQQQLPPPAVDVPSPPPTHDDNVVSLRRVRRHCSAVRLPLAAASFVTSVPGLASGPENG